MYLTVVEVKNSKPLSVFCVAISLAQANGPVVNFADLSQDLPFGERSHFTFSIGTFACPRSASRSLGISTVIAVVVPPVV